MKNLKEKVILVTGGGQGLGKEICTVLAEEGAHVIAADINLQKVNEVAAELKKKGFEAEGVELNIADDYSIKQALAHIEKNHGRIDALINNAGVDVAKPVVELTVEEIDRVLNVNLRGTFLMSKFTLEIMYKQKSGHIVNVASTASLRAWTGASAYVASKWGVQGLSRALYTEAREQNVKVSAVIPGGMRTPFILDRFPDVPLEKLQEPRNVAETIKFVLLGPEETIIPEIMVFPLMEGSWP